MEGGEPKKIKNNNKKKKFKKKHHVKYITKMKKRRLLGIFVCICGACNKVTFVVPHRSCFFLPAFSLAFSHVFHACFFFSHAF